MGIKDIFHKVMAKKDEDDKEFKEFEAIVNEELTPEIKKQIEAEFSEKLSEKDKKIADLEAEKVKAEKDKAKAEFKEFAKDLHKQGKLVSDQIDKIAEFCEIISNAREVEFSEGEKTENKNALEVFKEFLGKMPKVVETTEFAKNDNADFSEGTPEALGKQIADAINNK